eukprot:GHVS01037783.1.p1 GENE.GHVS01037783.1~~GHVS01037783.1.p1  ORF type:complete len:130 (+),score=18.64 GHVS01037783.1:79-468(+)
MKLLAWYRQHTSLFGFHTNETEALADALLHIPSSTLWDTQQQHTGIGVLVYVNLPLDEPIAAGQILLDRSVLLKHFVEVWSEGSSYDVVFEKIVNSPERVEHFRRHINDEKKWKFIVSACGSTLTLERE